MLKSLMSFAIQPAWDSDTVMDTCIRMRIRIKSASSELFEMQKLALLRVLRRDPRETVFPGLKDNAHFIDVVEAVIDRRDAGNLSGCVVENTFDNVRRRAHRCPHRRR